MVSGTGHPDMTVEAQEVRRIVDAGTPQSLYAGKRVLVLTPDATRTCPLPMMIKALQEVVGPHCVALDFMVALGTHPPMPEADILRLYGISEDDRKKQFAGCRFLNHRWDLPDTLATIGYLEALEIEAFSQGRLKERVPVAINRAVFDYDLILILGPVFPHEVVGFSGGAKYLFPGIAGGDFLHFFHWLGAVITCAGIIGTKDTPVRGVIHRALAMVDVPVQNIAMVVTPTNQLCGLYVGHVVESWSQAADLSDRVHIVYREAPFPVVFGQAPAMYDEIWVAGKVMYKLEQVVADGGRLIIYGPHIRHISRTWGQWIEKVGYHVRDYFLKQMDAFRDVPRGVLAHSTHVRGTGTIENGVERPRIEVVLATGIPEALCRKINLGYMDPAGINIDDYRHKEEQGILCVAHAGEMLYKLK
ncbi:MAG: DUF2088 domain-containing protein [Deltaproteobacteria bacterium]|nr:DUF2088 domain-containing protein [Deltaproteobacteria bacterium]